MATPTTAAPRTEAALRPAPLLLVDEAAAAVDSVAEADSVAAAVAVAVRVVAWKVAVPLADWETTPVL